MGAMITKEVLGEALVAIGKRVKSGKCELSIEQMESIFAEIERSVDIPMSKESACAYLGISRSTFDARVAEGLLPKGKHRRGFKELVWYKRELQ